MSFPHEIRSITADEFDEFQAQVHLGFGVDMTPAEVEAQRALQPLERTVACFDDGRIVGTLGDYPLQMTVPGGAYLATAGTTAVGVAATHTRRGILRAMVERHLEMTVERGEPIAALWASEAPIYGRFGFGQAAERHDVTFDARHVTLPPIADDLTVQMLPASELSQVVEMWKQTGRSRAGWLDRVEPRWADIERDPPHRRNGGSAHRHVIVRRGEAIVGFASFRHKEKWTDSLPNGTIAIDWMASHDLDAHRALWHHLADIDLFPHVACWNTPVDDPLGLEASDPRRIRRSVSDGIFVRLLDLEACLETRTYERDGTVILDVVDDLSWCAGRWQLTVTDGHGRVERLAADTADAGAPVARLDVRELGALFLGRDVGPRLAHVGAITGDSGAVRTLVDLLRTDRQPFCPEMF